MPRFERKDVEVLFNLKPVYNFVDFQRQCMEVEPSVKDTQKEIKELLSDLSDISKDEIFVQPYVIKKAKRICKVLPSTSRNTQKNSQKFLKKCILKKLRTGVPNQNHSKYNFNEFVPYDKQPSSPALSVDSAIDLSHDLYGEPFISITGNRSIDLSDTESAVDMNEFYDLPSCLNKTKQDKTMNSGTANNGFTNDVYSITNRHHKFNRSRESITKPVTSNREAELASIEIVDTQYAEEYVTVFISRPKVCNMADMKTNAKYEISCNDIIDSDSIPVVRTHSLKNCKVILKNVIHEKYSQQMHSGHDSRTSDKNRTIDSAERRKLWNYVDNDDSKILRKNNNVKQDLVLQEKKVTHIDITPDGVPSPEKSRSVLEHTQINDHGSEVGHLDNSETITHKLFKRKLNDVYSVPVSSGMAIRTRKMIVHDENEKIPSLFSKINQKEITPENENITLPCSNGNNDLSFCSSMGSNNNEEASLSSLTSCYDMNKKEHSLDRTNCFLIQILRSTCFGLLNQETKSNNCKTNVVNPEEYEPFGKSENCCSITQVATGEHNNNLSTELKKLSKHHHKNPVQEVCGNVCTASLKVSDQDVKDGHCDSGVESMSHIDCSINNINDVKSDLETSNIEVKKKLKVSKRFQYTMFKNPSTLKL